MRLIRPRLGLVLWACIALCVLMVPLWRVRAGHQWSSSLVPELLSFSIRDYEIPTAPQSSGLSHTDEQEALRRFPSDVEVQLACLKEGELVKKTNSLFQSPRYLIDPSQQADLQKQFVRAKSQIWKLTDDYFARYKVLERRFPDSNLVRAQHLRDVMAGSVITDEGLPAPIRKGMAMSPPVEQVFESWISPATRETALATARAGARREPNNAFFPWMEAILCFASNRNNDALLALERAGQCSEFRDYGLQMVALRLDVLRRLRTTGWEDDLTEFAYSLFPHLAKMRSAARTAMGQMRLARRRGDEARAFRFAAATVGAGAVVARSGQSTLISVLVGEAICGIAWQAAIENQPDAPEHALYSGSDQERREQITHYRQQIAAHFTEMARSRGQENIARESEVMVQSFDGQQLSDWTTTHSGGVEGLVANYWLGSQLLRLSLGGVLIWCLCWALTRRRVESFGRARAQMLIPTMFCVGVTGTLLLVFRTLIPPLYQFSQWLTDSSSVFEPHAGDATLCDRGAAIIAGLWFALVIVATLLSLRVRREKMPSSTPIWRPIVRVAAWALFIGCALVVLGVVTGGLSSPSVSDRVLYYSLVVVGLDVFVGAGMWIWRTSGLQRIIAIGSIATFCVSVWVLLVSTTSEDNPIYGAVALGLALLLAAVVFILGVRASNGGVSLLHIATEATLRARLVAGTLALFGALGYLAVALWTVPIEHTTRSLMSRQFQIGEAASLREQVQKASAH